MNFENILDDFSDLRQPSPDDYTEIIQLKREALEEEKKVKGGKIVTWILIALTVLGAVYEISTFPEPGLLMGIYAVILSIYLGGIFYTSQNTKHGFLAILIVFSLTQLLLIVNGDVISIIKGIIFKVIFLYFIIQGIIGAGKLNRIRQRLERLGS